MTPATESPEPPGAAGTEPAATSPGLPHFPALDGLRGLAVIGVVCFHGDFDWAGGGFLGVSTFFTLSGFLITSLLLLERDATGRIDLRAFWSRRFRRLIPAAYMGVALALLFALFAAEPSVRAGVGGDAAAAVAQVSNWWFLASDRSYADLFVGPSPLLHYWSLAVEEQFYVVFPLLATLLLARLGWSRTRFSGVVAATAVAAAVTPLVVDLAPDTVYYSTWTRAPELLVGVVLACVLQRPGVAASLAARGTPRQITAVVGAAALVGTIALWVLADRSDRWLYDGGFALYALVSVAVLSACLLPVGPVQKVLSLRAFTHLGLISYGVYIVHWPVFLWLDAERTGLDGAALFALRVVVSLGLAEASYRFVEQPIRHGSRLFGVRPSRALAPAALTLVVLGASVSATAPPPEVDFAAAQEELAVTERANAERPVEPAPAPAAGVLDPDLVATDPPTPTVAFFGDSTAMMVAYGAGAHIRSEEAAGRDPGIVPTAGIARLGCGITRGVERRAPGGEAEPTDPTCDRWPETWAEKVRVFSPDLAVVQVGPWDVGDNRVVGSDTWEQIGDPGFDARLYEEMLLAVDSLSVDGASVAWLTAPPVTDAAGTDSAWEAPDGSGGDRWDHFNEMVRQLEVDRPDTVLVIDHASWAEADGRDEELRPDGVHYTQDTSQTLWHDFLAAELVRVHRELWPLGAERRTALARTLADEPPPPAPAPGEALRVLVTGDGDAAELGGALAALGSEGSPMEVSTVAQPGCGITRPVERKPPTGTDPATCRLREDLLEAVRSQDPHVVLVYPGSHDLAEVDVVGGRAKDTRPGEMVYDDWFRTEYGSLVDELRALGPSVVVALPADTSSTADDRSSHDTWAGHASRMITDLARSRSRRSHVATVDVAGWFAALPGGLLDPAVRPDGAHLSADGARQLAEWLGPALRDELARLSSGEIG